MTRESPYWRISADYTDHDDRQLARLCAALWERRAVEEYRWLAEAQAEREDPPGSWAEDAVAARRRSARELATIRDVLGQFGLRVVVDRAKTRDVARLDRGRP